MCNRCDIENCNCGDYGFCVYCGEPLDEDGTCWDHPTGYLNEFLIEAFDFTTGQPV